MKNKLKKKYSAPSISQEVLELDSFIAASIGIQSGGTDGRGDHSISGAKGSAVVWIDDEEYVDAQGNLGFFWGDEE